MPIARQLAAASRPLARVAAAAGIRIPRTWSGRRRPVPGRSRSCRCRRNRRCRRSQNCSRRRRKRTNRWNYRPRRRSAATPRRSRPSWTCWRGMSQAERKRPHRRRPGQRRRPRRWPRAAANGPAAGPQLPVRSAVLPNPGGRCHRQARAELAACSLVPFVVLTGSLRAGRRGILGTTSDSPLSVGVLGPARCGAGLRLTCDGACAGSGCRYPEQGPDSVSDRRGNRRDRQLADGSPQDAAPGHGAYRRPERQRRDRSDDHRGDHRA